MKRISLVVAAIVLFAASPLFAQHPRMVGPGYVRPGHFFGRPNYSNQWYYSSNSYTPFGAYSYGNGPFGNFSQTTTFTPFGSYSYGSGIPSYGYGSGFAPYGAGFGGGY